MSRNASTACQHVCVRCKLLNWAKFEHSIKGNSSRQRTRWLVVYRQRFGPTASGTFSHCTRAAASYTVLNATRYGFLAPPRNAVACLKDACEFFTRLLFSLASATVRAVLVPLQILYKNN